MRLVIKYASNIVMTKPLLIAFGTLLNCSLIIGVVSFEKDWGEAIKGLQVSITPLISNIDNDRDPRMTPAPDKSPQNASNASSANGEKPKLQKPNLIMYISVKNTNKFPVSILVYVSPLIPQEFNLIKMGKSKDMVDLTKNISSRQTR